MEFMLADQDFQKLFEKLSNDGERVFAVYNLAMKFNLFSNLGSEKKQNDNSKANELRIEANKQFTATNFLEALKLYNQSLCFSEEDSKNISLVYAKRSAVYLEMGYYETCLKNIDLALNHKCSEGVKSKLLKRQEKCVELMNNQSGNRRREDQMEIELSYKANENIPFMVEGIEFVYNKKFGRGLVATRDFKAGDILIHEPPMLKTLNRENTYEYCFWCLKGNLMSLLPCKESTKIMFCSDECYSENLNHGLASEAKVLDSIDMDEFGFFRLILKLLSVFDDFDELQHMLNTVFTESTAIYERDYNQTTAKDRIRAFFNLASHHDKPNKGYFNLAARMFHLMNEQTHLKQKLVSDEQKITVMEAIYGACRILNVNCFPLRALDSKAAPIGKGVAVALISSLINHSCAPNAFIFGEDTVSIAAERPIKAGDQITISYVGAHDDHSLFERKPHLMNQYYFDCQCIACVKNYPMASQMLPRGLFRLEPIIDQTSKVENLCVLGSGYVEKVKSLLKTFIGIFEKYDKHYPCFELCNAAKELRYCVYRLYHNIPLQPQFRAELKKID